MLSKEDYLMIKAQLERGVYQKDIAAELGVGPRATRRAIKRGGAPDGRRCPPTSAFEKRGGTRAAREPGGGRGLGAAQAATRSVSHAPLPVNAIGTAARLPSGIEP